MRRKKLFGYVIAFFIVLLMVSSANAVNLTDNNVFEEAIYEQDFHLSEKVESDNNPEEQPAGFNFCILGVYVYVMNSLAGPRPMEFYKVVVEKGDRVVRIRITGFFGNRIFFGLKKGQTYKIRVKNLYVGYEVKEITIGRFFEKISLCVNPLGDPPYYPEIVGPTSGIAGTSYTYKFKASDIDEDDVRYHIDWGDGENETTKFYSTYTYATVSHTWVEEGTYTISVYAEDEHGLIGRESTLEVTMS